MPSMRALSSVKKVSMGAAASGPCSSATRRVAASKVHTAAAFGGVRTPQREGGPGGRARRGMSATTGARRAMREHCCQVPSRMTKQRRRPGEGLVAASSTGGASSVGNSTK